MFSWFVRPNAALSQDDNVAICVAITVPAPFNTLT
jgi:hypothetical protein